MIRVQIFVEGQTEETFVRELLYNHFLQQNIYVNPILLGGAVTYGKIRKELSRKCSEDSTAFVTTMLDLYGLPKDFPGKSSIPSTNNPFEKAEYLEKQMGVDIGTQNFIPNLLVHEFEGLLYSNPQAFLGWFDQSVVEILESERKLFPSPEHINDSPITAPSKRILRCCPGYDKPLHGSLIAMDIGLDTIRNQCQHFDKWLTKLENIK
ncbi:DUF4276 family protein [Okeanomitos corallinicola TIOX110]|uniref:DUF4276 family protein n=1 Tax=Okeanomitos corallinicola TIOX110 TaxID=3133117 RepID=A0ABZ2UWJ1_9CYAN